MDQDPFAELKKRQREMWASFAPTAMFTTPVAGHLVKFARIGPCELCSTKARDRRRGHHGCRAGAHVTAVDLTLASRAGSLFMERSVGPMQKLVESLVTEPERVAILRAEFDAMVAPYYFDNIVHQDYLLTRAQAK